MNLLNTDMARIVRGVFGRENSIEIRFKLLTYQYRQLVSDYNMLIQMLFSQDGCCEDCSLSTLRSRLMIE